jgi:DNA helicase-2/ATP-dependent DNA helicase PcrA
VPGNLNAQAEFVVTKLLPSIQQHGVPLEEIAVLYRDKRQGEPMAQAAAGVGIPAVRADSQALVSRSSRFSRFAEACARWVSGGWKDADPPFRRLSMEACVLVYGREAADDQRRQIETELISFLHGSIGKYSTAHSWLVEFRSVLVDQWRTRARNVTSDWQLIEKLIERTDPASPEGDIPLGHFGGKIEDGTGRLNLSTLHSAKGREFDAVILFGMNDDVLPSWHDERRPEALREARRLFYVGVTRPRRELHLVFQTGHNSPWVAELHKRLHSGS